jgi:MOSC domain-containing protein YiiM
MEISTLFNSMPQVGKIEWIGIRSLRRSELTEVASAVVTVEKGLLGDHYTGRNAKRQITLIQAEHLEAVAKMLQQEKINPQLTRRNIVVSGINLLAFNNRQFRLGEDLVLEMTGYCHPCTRMEENLGPGGYNAMRGHGGITAKVVTGGSIRLGDAVRLEASLATE